MAPFPVAVALPARRAATGLAAALLALLLTALVALQIYGVVANRLFTQQIWQPVGLERFLHYGGAYLAVALPVLLMVPWLFARLIAAALVVLSALSVGVVPVVAAAWFLISASAAGARLLGPDRDSAAHQLLNLLAGTAAYMCLMLATARLPIHYPLVWGAVLTIPVLADLRGTGRRLRFWYGLLSGAELRSGWERAAAALLVFVLVAHWLVALKPEIGTDGLAMHLSIAMNIGAHHQFTFDPARFLWAVMPMGADWVYATHYVLGGEYAAHLLNYAMLLVVAALIVSGARRWLPLPAALLLAASFAATPLVQLTTGSLFAENLLAALVVGTATAIWEFGDTERPRYLYAAALLGGAALTVKLGALAFLACALPLLAYEMVRKRRALGPRPWRVAVLLAVVFAATSLPTYAIAWWKTGDPLFPFLNQRFHTPLLDPTVVITDARYRIPLAPALYTLTFQSQKTYEGQNGSFGFQYLGLVPLVLAGLLLGAGKEPGRRMPGAALIALGGGTAIMLSQPNARYLYAGLPLITIAFAGLLGWTLEHRRWLFGLLTAWLVLCTALNLWFLPASSYYHKDFCLGLPFSRAERQRYIAMNAPIRAVIDYFTRHHAGAGVLLTSNPENAGLNGDIYENHWHQYNVLRQLRGALDVADLFHLVQRWKVRYFIAEKPVVGQHLARARWSACWPPVRFRNSRRATCTWRAWPRIAISARRPCGVPTVR